MTRDANLLTLGLLALALLAAPGPAASYVWNTCDGGSDWILWEADEGAACDGCAPMLISTVSFPPGSAGESEIILAMDSWNDIERSTANFTWSPGTDGEHAVDNGENEIYYDGIDGVGNTLAVTRLVYNGLGGNCLWLDDANISEADVEFDTVEAWYTSAFSYTSSSIHLQTVANHEFGHALGLLHEDARQTRLMSFWPFGGPIGPSRKAWPLADDAAGMRYLYSGSGTLSADLAGSNYYRTGSGSSALVSGPLSAARGSTVTIQYTFMNIGSAASGAFNIGFYLSSNDTISTYDRLLATNVGASAGSGGLGTYTRTLTIPGDVTPGTYYLGVLLDKDGAVSEWSEGNNGLAQPRTVSIF